MTGPRGQIPLWKKNSTDYLQIADSLKNEEMVLLSLHKFSRKVENSDCFCKAPNIQILAVIQNIFYLNREPNKTCLQTQLCSRIIIVFSRQGSNTLGGRVLDRVLRCLENNTEACLDMLMCKTALT